ncbi:MAG: hypothetical protein V4673_07630 [Pseudomonadota bacterium]
MKHFLLKSALISFAMVAAATAWARDSMPDTARQSTATDRAMLDRAGNPRSLRAQWVYRIVAKWGMHVQEAYRTDPRRWADSMAQVFAKASPDALKRAAEARTFAAMNDALLAGTNPAALQATTASALNGASSKRIAARSLGDPDRDLVYVPVTPCRILDTRIAGGPIPANSFRDFDLTDVIRYAPQGGDTSNCNVGDKGSFAATALNITVVTPSTAGYITAFPYLSSQPTAATLNYVAGDIRNGLAIVRLDQSAAINEFSVYSFAQTHLVADVVGYFREPEATALDCITVSATTIVPAGTHTAFSPSCPVGYTIVSGGCYPTTTNFNLWGSETSNTNHQCLVNVSGAKGVAVSARCCRIPGR